MRVWHLLDLDRRAIFNLAPLEVRNLIAFLSIPGSWLPQRHMGRGCECGGLALGCSTSLTESVALSPLGPRSQRLGAALAVSGEEGARQHTHHGVYASPQEELSVSRGKCAPGRGAPVNHGGAGSAWRGHTGVRRSVREAGERSAGPRAVTA